jgi:hypothetical protein
MVCLARDLDLLRGHLAQDSDGNAGCERSVACHAMCGKGKVSYGRGRDASETRVSTARPVRKKRSDILSSQALPGYREHARALHNH